MKEKDKVDIFMRKVVFVAKLVAVVYILLLIGIIIIANDPTGKKYCIAVKEFVLNRGALVVGFFLIYMFFSGGIIQIIITDYSKRKKIPVSDGDKMGVFMLFYITSLAVFFFVTYDWTAEPIREQNPELAIVHITIDVPKFKESVKLSGTLIKYRNYEKYERKVSEYSHCNPWEDAEDYTHRVIDGKIELYPTIPVEESFSLVLIIDNKFETENIIIGGVPMEYPQYYVSTIITMTEHHTSRPWKCVEFKVNKEGVVTERYQSSDEPPQNYTGVF